MLNAHQLNRIDSDVQAALITVPHLSDELLDHICCEVENLMSQGKSFEEAYVQIKKESGEKNLQKVQENTLLLIDKNYALMKTIMKIAGNIALVLLALGTTFKIFHWPGAGIALVSGFFLMCFFFFPSGIYMAYKERGEKANLGLSLSILFGGIAFMAGIMFKVQHWPGASLLLMLGWLLILLVFLPILLFVKLQDEIPSKERRVYVLGAVALVIFEFSTMFKMFHWPGAGILMILGSVLLVGVFLPLFAMIRYKTEAKKTAEYIFVITTVIYAVVLTTLLSLNVSSPLVDSFVNQARNSTVVLNYFEQKLISQRSSILTATDSVGGINTLSTDAIQKEGESLRADILKMKMDLVMAVDGVDDQTALGLLSNPSGIRGKDNLNQINQMFFAEEDGGVGKKFKKDLSNFREHFLSSLKSDPRLYSMGENLLPDILQEYNQEGASWEEVNFRDNMLISTLTLLTNIQTHIAMAEMLLENKAIQINTKTPQL